MKQILMIAGVILLITACKKDKGTAPKTGINLSLTANSTYDFDDIKVGFQSVEYQTSDAPSTWISLPLIATGSKGFINFHTILHGNATDLSNAEIPLVHIINFRIKFVPQAFVSKKGVLYPLIIPDDIKQNGVIVPADGTITTGKLKPIVIVYNTNRSIISGLSSNTFTFRPNMRSFDPAVCGTIEGYIKPDEAMPYITISADSTSSTATFNEISVPYTGGYYKMIGVPAGKYNVKMSAVNPDYAPRQVTNIGVFKSQTAEVGTFTLKN